MKQSMKHIARCTYLGEDYPYFVNFIELPSKWRLTVQGDLNSLNFSISVF